MTKFIKVRFDEGIVVETRDYVFDHSTYGFFGAFEKEVSAVEEAWSYDWNERHPAPETMTEAEEDARFDQWEVDRKKAFDFEHIEETWSKFAWDALDPAHSVEIVKVYEE